MQLNDKVEVIWEPVNPDVVKMYDAALQYHLHCQNKTEPKETE